MGKIDILQFTKEQGESQEEFLSRIKSAAKSEGDTQVFNLASNELKRIKKTPKPPRPLKKFPWESVPGSTRKEKKDSGFFSKKKKKQNNVFASR